MKKILLILILSAVTFPAYGHITIYPTPDRQIVHGERIRRVASTFCKPIGEENMGICVHYSIRQFERHENRLLYFRFPRDEVFFEDKNIYYYGTGSKILLAQKNFWGWQTLSGVNLKKAIRRIGGGYEIFVNITIED
ncbi:MAG: hypothetical protein MI862_01815 [Desulfobacterales bacterium]|nr:hypothetical protein [Desulfobacterales bacterium]